MPSPPRQHGAVYSGVGWTKPVVTPRTGRSQHIPDVPYAEWAKPLGFTGIRCDSPKKIGAAWDEALASDKPVILEVVVDPEIPPVPPRIKKMQAKELREGDPEMWGITTKGGKQKMHEFTEPVKRTLPGTGD